MINLDKKKQRHKTDFSLLWILERNNQKWNFTPDIDDVTRWRSYYRVIYMAGTEKKPVHIQNHEMINYEESKPIKFVQ
jgi:hypothetical protein